MLSVDTLVLAGVAGGGRDPGSCCSHEAAALMVDPV
jgi:hypothetical protein